MFQKDNTYGNKTMWGKCMNNTSKNFEKVERRIAPLKNELLSLAGDLIAIPTVNPPGRNYSECAEFLAGTLKEIGFEAKIIKVPDELLPSLAPHGEGLPRPIVLASLTKGGKTPELHFNGHYDVVPATGSWSTDPFEPVVKDGKLYGRGSSDMKGGIASMIIAARALIESEVDFNGTISFSLTPDEETDGFAGSGFINQRRMVKADYCIIAEPSGVENVFNAHKGSLWLEITALGKTAHGSTPWLGVNAFEKILKIARAIDEELKPRLAKKVSKFQTTSPGGNTATIMLGGIVRGGTSVNTVPERCSFTVDRRFIPEESIDEVKDEIFDLLQKLQDQDEELKIETKILTETDSCYTSLDSPLCMAVVESVAEVTNKKPSVTMCMGSLDMRYFVNAGVPTISYGPGNMQMAHVENECVSIEDLMTSAKVYALAALKLLSMQEG